MAAYVLSEVQWAGSKANHKQEHEFSLCHPTRRGEGNNMGRLQDRRRCLALITSASDDTWKKTDAFKYILPLTFFPAFVYTVLSFTKTCLKMTAGHDLLSKHFIRCHRYLTLAKLQ